MSNAQVDADLPTHQHQPDQQERESKQQERYAPNPHLVQNRARNYGVAQKRNVLSRGLPKNGYGPEEEKGEDLFLFCLILLRRVSLNTKCCKGSVKSRKGTTRAKRDSGRHAARD